MRFNLGIFKINFLLLVREILFLLDLKFLGVIVKGRICVRMNLMRRKVKFGYGEGYIKILMIYFFI